METAQIVRTAEEQPVENRHLPAAIHGIDRGQLALGEEDEIPRQGEVLGTFQRDTVVIDVLLSGDAGEEHVQSDKCALAGEEEVVSVVEGDATAQSIAEVIALLVGIVDPAERSAGDLRDTRAEIINADSFGLELRIDRDEVVDRVAQLDRAAVVRLVVIRTEERRVAVERFRTER